MPLSAYKWTWKHRKKTSLQFSQVTNVSIHKISYDILLQKLRAALDYHKALHIRLFIFIFKLWQVYKVLQTSESLQP